ncbi:MAG: hypothetical protein H6765_00875 [Candidatus Peribacteria bacterium]|nr:MAG: hypothetical protein H6765_00875 [Candidatus Peribacteria bacterium]
MMRIKSFVSLSVLTILVLVLSACSKQESPTEEFLPDTTGADIAAPVVTIPEEIGTRDHGILRKPLEATPIHSGGETFDYNQKQALIGYNEGKPDMIGNEKVLYRFENISGVVLDTGYIYFQDGEDAYRYDFADEGVYAATTDASGTLVYDMPYHVSEISLSQAEFDQ